MPKCICGLPFHDRLLTADNLCKRNLLISSLYLLCGANSEIVEQIFFHCPFILELWELEKICLAISSCPSTIANFWGEWRRFSIPHIETNYWDCVVNAIIWVVLYERNSKLNRLPSWSLEVRYLIWFPFGNPTSLFTNAASHHNVLYFDLLVVFLCSL